MQESLGVPGNTYGIPMGVSADWDECKKKCTLSLDAKLWIVVDSSLTGTQRADVIYHEYGHARYAMSQLGTWQDGRCASFEQSATSTASCAAAGRRAFEELELVLFTGPLQDITHGAGHY